MISKDNLTHIGTNLVVQLLPDESGVLRVATTTAHHLYKDDTVVIPEYYQMQAPPLAYQEEISLSNKATKALEDIDWDPEAEAAKDEVVADLTNSRGKRERIEKRQLKEKKAK